jgi:integrase
MMMFMFDSEIRSPTELMNVMVSDLEWNNKGKYYTLNIREETSKTFGRKIKLLLCSEVLKEYIENQKLPPEYQIFKKDPHRVNLYIKRLGFRILNLGEGEIKISKGKKFPAVKAGLTMYDFRHSSACYWLPRYKSESALKYRFGWKKSEMIYYYTQFLGMSDTIETDDLYTDITKTELEQQITQKAREMELMQERMQEQDNKLKEVMDILKAIQMEKLLEEPVLQTPR